MNEHHLEATGGEYHLTFDNQYNNKFYPLDLEMMITTVFYDFIFGSGSTVEKEK